EEAVTQAEIETAVRDMKTMQRLLLDTGGQKEKLLRMLENALSPVLKGFRISVMMRPKDLVHSMRYANEEHRPWRNPNLPEVTRHDSFNDLFDQAKAEYRALCAGVRE
ncbi:MAG: hypothetical protein LIO46_06180, partial [Clostridiales bacterium]|nr:hypothetical protein [Clostridiales bacterium]